MATTRISTCKGLVNTAEAAKSAPRHCARASSQPPALITAAVASGPALSSCGLGFSLSRRVACYAASSLPTVSGNVANIASSSENAVQLPVLLPLDDQYEARHAFAWFAHQILPGRLLLGRYPYVEPGRCNDREQGEQQITQILEAGVTTFVCLQDELPPQSEMRAGGLNGFLPYRPVADLILSAMNGPPPMESLNALRNDYLNKFLPAARTKGSAPPSLRLKYVHFPIVDLSVPDLDKLLGLVVELQRRLQAGENLYVHCWGGRGRAGTVGACLLIHAYGLTAKEALERVQRSFDTRRDDERRSPETDEQRALVQQFATLRAQQ